MKKILARLRQNKKLLLGSSIIVSLGFGISMIMGYLTAKFLAGSGTKIKGRLPSIAFNIQKYRIHLHHWLIFLAFLVLFIYFNFFVFTAKVFYGFFGGVIYQGISHYDDWAQIVTKHVK